jgi:hypothetical protein
MKIFAILSLVAALAFATPMPEPKPNSRRTPAHIRDMLIARQVECLCDGGEWCCTYECTPDSSCPGGKCKSYLQFQVARAFKWSDTDFKQELVLNLSTKG